MYLKFSDIKDINLLFLSFKLVGLYFIFTNAVI